MAIEIERKYRLDKKRLVELTAKLTEVGAEFLDESFEENYVHKGGVLDKRDAVLRLRKTSQRATLTYKEKVATDDEFKRQIEYETMVSDVDGIENIIEQLGFKLAIVYEKHRKSWRLGNVEVVLDELPFGYFMEIEGAMDDIVEAEKLLGAGDLEIEARGYPRLTLKYGIARKGVIESRFDTATPRSNG